MNQKRWWVWPLFVLWVPVGLVYGIANVIVFLVAKAAWRINRGLWWLQDRMEELPLPVTRFFGEHFKKKNSRVYKQKLDKSNRWV